MCFHLFYAGDSVSFQQSNESFRPFFPRNVAEPSNLTWILDSGSSPYMTFDKNIFLNFIQEGPKSLNIDDGLDLDVHRRGDVEIVLPKNDIPKVATIKIFFSFRSLNTLCCQ